MSVTRFRPRPLCARWGLLALLGLVAGSAAGQPPTQPGEEHRWVARIAADEQALWLAQVDPQHSLAYRRGVNEPFQPREPLHAPIVNMVVSDGALYAFVEDGSFYSSTDEGWSRQRDLSHRAQPLDLAGDETGVYALIHSPPPGEMPRLVGGQRPPTSQPFDPGDAPLSVARHDSQGWVAVAPCPASLNADGPLPPRVGFIHGTLCLLWRSADGRRVEYVRLDSESGEWRPGGATPAVPALNRFWIATVSRVPTIIVATRASRDGETLSAFRVFGGLDEEAADWRSTPLRLSDLPEGTRPGRYETAFGFNQHVVLLMIDDVAGSYLRFGRADTDPAEATVLVADVFDRRHGPGQALRWLQGTTLLVLFAVLLALILFRRGAMVTAVVLPDECALALTFQRLVGWLIDLPPFAIAAAAIVEVDWEGGLRELFGWAAGSDAAAGNFPAAITLVWWSVSCGGYTAYSLMMELLTGRTVGKVLMGTRLLSEAGTPPTAVQIVSRNLFRFLEMMPPLWILGFLVVLSRNRQRLGDIFARTVVVRRAKVEETK